MKYTLQTIHYQNKRIQKNIIGHYLLQHLAL